MELGSGNLGNHGEAVIVVHQGLMSSKELVQGVTMRHDRFGTS